MRHFKPYRHISNGAIIRNWSAARTDHRAEPEQQPAPRALHWRVKVGSWPDQPRAHRDQQKRRAHLRRQQRQALQQKRAASMVQLKQQQ